MGTVGSDEELTRKQRRENARAERRAAEEAAVTDAARRKRLAHLGVVVAVVVLAILAILIVTHGGSRTPSRGGGRIEVAAVSGLLAGTTQRGTVLGSPTAPVTMQYFGDLECSACRDFTLGALPSI